MPTGRQAPGSAGEQVLVPAGGSLAAGGTDVAAGSLPPPLEANDQLVAVVVTAVWAVALVVLLLVRGDIRSSERWWIWTAAAGVGLGLFALAYLPHLKRSRERAALRRSGGPEQAGT